MFPQIMAILWKDLLSEFRTKEMVISMLVFSLMVTVIFNFSFTPGSEFIQEAAAGILWMTFIFASLLGMNRAFVYEVDKGCLQGLMLAPVDRVVIYISKFLVNFIFITLVELIVLPLFSIFFQTQHLACAAGIADGCRTWHPGPYNCRHPVLRHIGQYQDARSYAAHSAFPGIHPDYYQRRASNLRGVAGAGMERDLGLDQNYPGFRRHLFYCGLFHFRVYY